MTGAKLTVRAEIQEIVDRETRAWDTQDLDLLMTVSTKIADGWKMIAQTGVLDYTQVGSSISPSGVSSG